MGWNNCCSVYFVFKVRPAVYEASNNKNVCTASKAPHAFENCSHYPFHFALVSGPPAASSTSVWQSRPHSSPKRMIRLLICIFVSSILQVNVGFAQDGTLKLMGESFLRAHERHCVVHPQRPEPCFRKKGMGGRREVRSHKSYRCDRFGKRRACDGWQAGLALDIRPWLKR